MVVYAALCLRQKPQAPKDRHLLRLLAANLMQIRTIAPLISLAALALAVFVIVYSASADDRVPFYFWFLPLALPLALTFFVRYVSMELNIEIGNTKLHISQNKLKEGDAEKIKKALSE